MPFSRDDLATMDKAKAVRIETSAGPDSPVHRTIIWVVVDGEDVFVRSWRGVTARWYREALANPDIAIHLGKRRLAAAAVPARDPDSVARTSKALERKYEVLRQHCERVGRPYEEIRKTILWNGSVPFDGSFADSLAPYAEIGVEEVFVTPSDDDPVGFARELVDQVVEPVAAL